MPASAPDYIEDEDERNLYRDISRVYEDFCGGDETKYPAKIHSFINVMQVVIDTLKTAREKP